MNYQHVSSNSGAVANGAHSSASLGFNPSRNGAKDSAASLALSEAKPAKTDCLIVIAKDQEHRYVTNYFQMSGKLRTGTFRVTVSNESFPLEQWNLDGKHTFVIALLNAAGVSEVEVVMTALLQELTPNFVTTIGICGGFAADSQKVIMFTRAAFLESISTIYTAHYKREIMNELWRDHQSLIVRPSRDTDKGHLVLTLSEKSPPEEESDAFLKKLQDSQAKGQDMEIAAIWKCCKLFDGFGHKGLKILPAFKAVSDSGLKSDRKRNEKFALENAAGAFLEYVKRGPF